MPFLRLKKNTLAFVMFVSIIVIIMILHFEHSMQTVKNIIPSSPIDSASIYSRGSTSLKNGIKNENKISKLTEGQKDAVNLETEEEVISELLELDNMLDNTTKKLENITTVTDLIVKRNYITLKYGNGTLEQSESNHDNNLSNESNHDNNLSNFKDDNRTGSNKNNSRNNSIEEVTDRPPISVSISSKSKSSAKPRVTSQDSNKAVAMVTQNTVVCKEKVEILFEENDMLATVYENMKPSLLDTLNVLPNTRTLSLDIRTFPDWFSSDDIRYMQMMSVASIDDVYTIHHHLQLKMLVFDSYKNSTNCTQGKMQVPLQRCLRCGLRKMPKDTDEIFAFHLDRVLGVNRTPPAIARVFKDFAEPESENDWDERNQKAANSTGVYPIMWWDPEIGHDTGDGAFMKDQNSLSISWSRYQMILHNLCWVGKSTPAEDEDCPIYHQDWVRMAIFDFILQNHDRLDRECCGFTQNIGDDLNCFTTEEQHCVNTPDNRWLVHIFTRSSDPRRLVFIDNKFNTARNGNNLNYLLLEGITSIPTKIAERLRSTDLRDILFESLRHDQVYWNNVLEGEKGAVRLWGIIKERIQALMNYANVHGWKTLD
ncbi:Golgi-associated kinase 1B-like [Amphiura filiformis]|uniref:Golgi-associated kinase 1B-like n=1 Tax=Amphiura filiformis TaxID=82378 RepID=UPI003B2146DA